MAENDQERSGEDLTEESSPYRLEEYRRKGIVAQSRELTGVAALLAAGGTLYAMGPRMGDEVGEFMREVFRTDLSSRLDLGATGVVHGYLMKAIMIGIHVALPVALAGFAMGAFSSFAQIGAIFTFDPLTPDFDKVNPLSGLKRMFSGKQLTESLRMLIKLAAVLLIAYTLVKAEILRSPGHMGEEPGDIARAYGQSAKTMFLSLLGVLAAFAGLDLWLQRWEYGKQLRMTKQEAKQEHREREGDPQIKARIRAVQREMSRRRMMEAVKKAHVVVTNPTHIAIAIVYENGKMAAPKVVAKGADFLAQRIKKIAADAGVPLVENVPLARTLYKTVKVNQQIPRALYQAVAEVLAYVYRLKNQRF